LFDEQSDFLDFTPISAFITPVDTTLLLADTSEIFPVTGNYPLLQSNAFVGVVRPFTTVPGAVKLYDGELIAKDDITLSLSPWNGVSTVMAKKNDTQGEAQFILSVLELQKLDGLGNVNELMEEILINEFGL
jgi:hypothetical protein